MDQTTRCVSFAVNLKLYYLLTANSIALAPPTYEEVAKMDILERQLDNEENDGEFSPKYPVYHFQENEKLKNDQSGFQ